MGTARRYRAACVYTYIMITRCTIIYPFECPSPLKGRHPMPRSRVEGDFTRSHTLQRPSLLHSTRASTLQPLSLFVLRRDLQQCSWRQKCPGGMCARALVRECVVCKVRVCEYFRSERARFEVTCLIVLPICFIYRSHCRRRRRRRCRVSCHVSCNNISYNVFIR